MDDLSERRSEVKGGVEPKTEPDVRGQTSTEGFFVAEICCN